VPASAWEAPITGLRPGRLADYGVCAAPAMKPGPKIIAGSLQRLRLTRGYAELRARLRADARLRHAGAFATASLWRRIWLNVEIEREVEAKLRKAWPPDALYAVRH